MKNRFQRLSKEEQKSAIKEYADSSKNRSEVVRRVKRIKVVSLLGIIYGIGNFIYALFISNSIVDYIFSAGTLVACVILYVKSSSLLVNNVNRYLVEKVRSKQKEEFKKEFGEE